LADTLHAVQNNILERDVKVYVMFNISEIMAQVQWNNIKSSHESYFRY